MTTFRYTNATRDFWYYGTEFLFRYPLTDRLLLQTNYTFTQHEEGEGLRIPKHKVNASFRQQFNSNTQLLTSIQFVGDRDDLVGQDFGGVVFVLVIGFQDFASTFPSWGIAVWVNRKRV